MFIGSGYRLKGSESFKMSMNSLNPILGFGAVLYTGVTGGLGKAVRSGLFGVSSSK